MELQQVSTSRIRRGCLLKVLQVLGRRALGFQARLVGLEWPGASGRTGLADSSK